MNFRLSGIIVSTALTALLSVATVSSIKASVGAKHYFDARYSKNATPKQQIALLHKSIELYPANYRAYNWASYVTFYSDKLRASETYSDNMTQYTDKALTLNPYVRSHYLIKCRYLAERDKQRASELWDSYVFCNFWDPENHRILTELHSKAGNFSKARKSMHLIRQFKSEHNKAHKAYNDAWKAEVSPDSF